MADADAGGWYPAGPGAPGDLTTERFLHAVDQQIRTAPMSPTVLSCAAARLLPVDGAGISTVLDSLRLPLGATGTDARIAEELQTTLGDGPCLTAAREARALLAGEEDLRRRWPLYGEALTAHTPFRSVAAVPVRIPGGVPAAIDLYATDADLGSRLDLDLVELHLAPPIAALLGLCMRDLPDPLEERRVPHWFLDVSADRRQVWVAMGMIIGGSSVNTSGVALDLLRCYAFVHDLGLDVVAQRVVQGWLPVADLQPDRG